MMLQRLLVVGLAWSACLLAPAGAVQDAPPSNGSEIAEVRQEILDLEKDIAAKQAEWDKLYAEYQRIMNNSGGRPGPNLRMKVNNLDSDARKIKAEIDAKKRVLETTREHLAKLERGTRSSGRRTGDANGSSDGRSGAAEASLPEELGALDSPISELLPIVDEWDPVGALGPARAVIRRWYITKEFGSRVRSEKPEESLVLFLADGRRALESDSGAFGLLLNKELLREAPSGSFEWVREEQRGDLIRLHPLRVSGLDPSGLERLAEEAQADRVGMVLRVDTDGRRRGTVVYDEGGGECASMTTEYEQVGDLVRPVLHRVAARGVYSYRVIFPHFNDGRLTQPLRVLEWKYEPSGRIAALRLRREANPDLSEVERLLRASDTPESREIRDRCLAAELQQSAELRYSYDSKGRLKTVRSEFMIHRLDPITEFRRVLLADQGKSGRGAVGAARAIAESKAAEGPQNKPGDGVETTVMPDGTWRNRIVAEMRIEDWDSRGRWIKSTMFVLDEGAEVECLELEREFTDFGPVGPPIHGEFQLLPRSRTPQPADLQRLHPVSTPTPEPTPEPTPDPASEPAQKPSPVEVPTPEPQAAVVAPPAAASDFSPTPVVTKPTSQHREPSVAAGSDPPDEAVSIPLWMLVAAGTAVVGLFAALVTLLLLRRSG